MYKLPVLNIIIEAFWFPLKYKLQFLNALALPLFLVVGIVGFSTEVHPESQSFKFGIYLLYVYALSFFTVSCHRLILLKTDKRASPIAAPMLKRIIVFTIWGIIVYILAGIPLAFILTLASNITSSAGGISGSHNLTNENFNWVKLLLMLPFGYLLGRFSLVFPATAVDVTTSIKWSWVATKNNGIRMLILIGGIPWISTIFLGLLWRENGTMFEYVFLSILGYLVFAVEIFILSIAFRELHRIEQVGLNKE